MTKFQIQMLEMAQVCGILIGAISLAYLLWRRSNRRAAWLAASFGILVWLPPFWPSATKSQAQMFELLFAWGVLLLPILFAGLVWQRGGRWSALFVAVVGAGLWIPVFAPIWLAPQSVKQERICRGRLVAIRLAKLDWAAKTKQAETAVPQLSDLVPFTKPYLQEEAPLTCPNGGTYTTGPVNERPRCSYHRSAHLPRADNPQPSTAYGCLGTYTLGAVNELPRCSHADIGHRL